MNRSPEFSFFEPRFLETATYNSTKFVNYQGCTRVAPVACVSLLLLLRLVGHIDRKHFPKLQECERRFLAVQREPHEEFSVF